MTGLLILGGIALLAVIIVISIYNGIIERFNKVKRSWSDVIVQERQKDKIIPELEKVVKEHNAYESGLQEKITQLRTAMSALSDSTIDTNGIKKVEEKTQDLMKGINVSVENYPELKASSMYSKLMTELVEQQENVSAALRIFNKNVEFHNSGIEVFPNSLVNSKFNKKEKLDSFSDSETSNNFEFKPNL